jgi:aminoglycoside phosphotransferase (APT) family kinase protein
VDLIDALRPVLAGALGLDQVDQIDARPMSAGASRLTWALDVHAAGTVRRLVLQRERVAGRGTMQTATEARLLRAAESAGVPVPAVIASGTDPNYLVTSHVDGETLPRRILRDPDLASARAGFAADCGRILAGIATMAVDPALPALDPLDAIEALLDRSGTWRPAFELALRWLRTHRPAGWAPTVVHGDFRLGNLIVGPDGVRAVLDWELAHTGDPREDLGWLCARVWRFDALGSIADLLDAYARHGGTRLEPADLTYWLVLATLRWGAICLEQSRVHLAGEFRSVELAAIGRRAAEMEYELLRMLP